ncbi:AI-2E family transporter [Hathewaya histolytica]|uniref:Permease n=1 Tax=Hathewaya histolytica TaxID=1498 RepID=A0A4U9QXN6_HATHI|nr:AI-2E family transporter [Hathewaya histolytica]VTQ83259.1 permease [Hathewaya histolytica]
MMDFKKFKDKKYMDIIIPIAIAAFLVFISSIMFLKLLDITPYFLNRIGNIYSIISPFIYGIIIAYILNPLMRFLEKKFKLKRSISILCTYLIIVGLFIIVIIYLLPKITTSIMEILRSVPQYTRATERWVNNLLNNSKAGELINTSVGANFNPEKLISKASEFSISVLNSFLANLLSITNYFIKWIFGFLIAIYVLADKENFKYVSKKAIYKTLKEKNGNRFLRLLSTLNSMIGTYIGTKALDSLIVAIIALIGLMFIKSPYALLIAIAVGITNMIPYFGPFVGMFVAGVINIFYSPIKALIVVGFLFLLQQFDGWYLDPKLIGDKVGLSPFLVMLAVTLGGGLYGVVGMILSVPVMAVIKIYVDKVF